MNANELVHAVCGIPPLKAPPKITARPRTTVRTDFIDTLDLRVGDTWAGLDCYGHWEKGYAETRLEPGEPDGWALTHLDLILGERRYDVTDSEILLAWAAAKLLNPEEYA